MNMIFAEGGKAEQAAIEKLSFWNSSELVFIEMNNNILILAKTK